MKLNTADLQILYDESPEYLFPEQIQEMSYSGIGPVARWYYIAVAAISFTVCFALWSMRQPANIPIAHNDDIHNDIHVVNEIYADGGAKFFRQTWR